MDVTYDRLYESIYDLASVRTDIIHERKYLVLEYSNGWGMWFAYENLSDAIDYAIEHQEEHKKLEKLYGSD